MQFELKQKVTIVTSGETGEIIGRGDYTHSEATYLIRYKSSDGRAVENWWNESALVATE